MAGARLEGCNLDGADLRGADLQRLHGEGLQLKGAQLQGTKLQQANLRKAILDGSNAEFARLDGANLEGASLREANLEGARLAGCNLLQADIYGANLINTTLRLVSFKGQLMQEVRQDYDAAKEIYTHLKTNFRSLGHYDDASWAYIMERRMERKAIYEHSGHNLHWLANWLADVTCVYGESPSHVFLTSGCVIAVFAVLYALMGSVGDTETILSRLSNAFLFSLSTFATINLAGLDAWDLPTRFAASLEALLGIAMLALLMFTLGNRVRKV